MRSGSGGLRRPRLSETDNYHDVPSLFRGSDSQGATASRATPIPGVTQKGRSSAQFWVCWWRSGTAVREDAFGRWGECGHHARPTSIQAQASFQVGLEATVTFCQERPKVLLVQEPPIDASAARRVDSIEVT
jgi:hypothetical protein